MSVNLLEHRSLAVTLPEELEAFLHVLIYNAVRFLRHNYDPVVPFIKKYFDGQDEIGGTLFSSEHKRACIRVHAGVNFRGSELVFKRSDGGDHALNAILKDLFHLFKGRYTALDYDTAKLALMTRLDEEKKQEKEQEKLLETAPESSKTTTSSPSHDAFDLLSVDVDWYIGADKVDEGQDAESIARGYKIEKPSATTERELVSLKEPTEDDRSCQVNCRQHDTFFKILTQNRTQSGWDGADRIKGDRLKHHVQDSVMFHSEDPVERPAKMSKSDRRLSYSTNVHTA